MGLGRTEDGFGNMYIDCEGVSRSFSESHTRGGGVGDRRRGRGRGKYSIDRRGRMQGRGRVGGEQEDQWRLLIV